PRVETEPVTLDAIGPAADALIGLQHRYAVPALTQMDGRAEPTEPSPHDQRVAGAFVPGAGRHFLRRDQAWHAQAVSKPRYAIGNRQNLLAGSTLSFRERGTLSRRCSEKAAATRSLSSPYPRIHASIATRQSALKASRLA